MNKLDERFVSDKYLNFYKKTNSNPTVDDIPSELHALWLNTETGEIFVYMGLLNGKAVWKGQYGTIITPPTVSKFDFFGDGSAVALYQFDGNANDTGGNYNGTWVGTEQYDVGKFGQAAKFDGTNSVNCGVINTTYDELWISFWMYWDGSYGTDGVMPIGFYKYDLWLRNGYFGWNTSAADIYGIDFPASEYANKWLHVVVNFKTGSYGDTMYINGVKQVLSQKMNSINSSDAVIKNVEFHISGYGDSNDYLFRGLIDQVRIFNRALTEDEVQQLYNEVG
jgi:hypothetical protein